MGTRAETKRNLNQALSGIDKTRNSKVLCIQTLGYFQGCGTNAHLVMP